MSRGLCFYIDYNAPMLPLAVALWTLKRSYSGDVCVIAGSHTSPDWIEVLKGNGISTAKSSVMFNSSSYRIVQCWLNKILVHRHEIPFDTGILYDCDHLFIDKFDDSAFDVVERTGLVSFHRSRGEIRFERLSRIDETVGKLPKMIKVNGGCVGSVRGSPLIDEWKEMAERMNVAKWNLQARKHADEYSLSYVMGIHGIELGDQKWSYSVSDAQDMAKVERTPGLLALHYPLRRFRASKVWLSCLQAAFSEDWLNLKSGCEMYGVNKDGSLMPEAPDSYFSAESAYETPQETKG